MASIFRLTVTLRTNTLTDATWTSADIATWSLVEPGCYLIAACLPTLRPLFSRVLQQVKTSVASGPSKHSRAQAASSQSETYVELV